MKAKFLDDNFYHVYNRGVHKSRIFFMDGNYEYCLDLNGTLFESRAQSLHVDSETYLLRLVCYLHCNPVAAGLVRAPEQWRHSDYFSNPSIGFLRISIMIAAWGTMRYFFPSYSISIA